MKAVHSWSKPDNVPGLLGRKQVDHSALQEGVVIPLEFIPYFENANGGVRIERGQRQPVVLLHRGIKYRAVLGNVNRQSPSDTLRIMWSGDRGFKSLLSETFSSSRDYIERERAARTITGSVSVPEEMAEYIEFYQTDGPFQYRVEFVPIIWSDFKKYVSSSQMQYSYKLVLLKAMLSVADTDGTADIASVEQFFRNYYLMRMNNGLKPDAEKAIVNNIAR